MENVSVFDNFLMFMSVSESLPNIEVRLKFSHFCMGTGLC